MQTKWALLKDHSRTSRLLLPDGPSHPMKASTPVSTRVLQEQRKEPHLCWHMEGLLSMGFTCGIKGSLQGLHKSLDFRHILLQGLSSKEGVDFGSFVTMFTIYCHQPGKSMINYFRGEESNTNSLGNAHKPQKLVFQRSLVAFDIINSLLLRTTSASGFSGLKTQNPGKHTYFLKCIS